MSVERRVRDLEDQVETLVARVAVLEGRAPMTKVVRVLDVPPVGQTCGTSFVVTPRLDGMTGGD